MALTLNVTVSGTGSNIYTWSSVPHDPSLAGQENDMEIEVSPTVNTVYTVTVEGPDGCELTDQIAVTYLAVPTFSISSTAKSCDPQETEVFSIIGLTGVSSYTWQLPSGATYVSGQCTATYTISDAPQSGYTVTVTVVFTNGCTVVESFVVEGCCLIEIDKDEYAPNVFDESFPFGTNPGLTVTGSGTTIFNQTFTINGTWTLITGYTLILENCTIALGPDASIIVPDGAKLDIKGSHLYACDEMWDRIDVANVATLHIHDESLIEDGKNVVVIRDGADYEIEYSTFNRNYYHITVTYDLSTPANGVGFVKYCEFRCQTTASLPPGTPVYENLNPPHENDISLVGVYSVLPTGLDVQHCAFSNMDFVVFALGTEDVLLRNNNFKDLTEFAVYATECGDAGGEVQITSSMIEGTPQGIFCYDNPNAILDIHGNELHFAGISSPPQVMRGIFVDEITPASPNKLSMYNNKTYDAPTGIMVRNLQGSIDLVNGTGAVFVGLNIVEHTKTQTDDQAGILVENCSNLLVIDNDVTHPSGTENEWETGITVRDGNTNFLICNHSHQIGNGFLFENDQRPLTIFAKNVMEDNQRGLWLVDGIIGQQGVSGTPYDNEWKGTWSPTNPSTLTDGINAIGTLSPFNVRPSGDYLPTENHDINFAPSEVFVSTITGTWTNGCMFTHPSYKTGEGGPVGMEESVAVLEQTVTADTDRARGMRWAGEYGLYKRLLADSELPYAEPALMAFHADRDNGTMGLLHRSLHGLAAARQSAEGQSAASMALSWQQCSQTSCRNRGFRRCSPSSIRTPPTFGPWTRIMSSACARLPICVP